MVRCRRPGPRKRRPTSRRWAMTLYRGLLLPRRLFDCQHPMTALVGRTCRLRSASPCLLHFNLAMYVFTCRGGRLQSGEPQGRLDSRDPAHSHRCVAFRPRMNVSPLRRGDSPFRRTSASSAYPSVNMKQVRPEKRSRASEAALKVTAIGVAGDRPLATKHTSATPIKGPHRPPRQ